MLNKIGFKLIFAVSVTSLLIIGIFSYFNINSQRDVLISEVERHAIQLSETIKKSTHDDMLAYRTERVHSIINTIGEEPSIEHVRIFNKEGEIIYSTNPVDIGTMLDKNAESCYACHSKDKPIEKLEIEDRTRIYRLHPDSSRFLGIINPIYNHKSCWEADCHVHSQNQTVLGVLDITLSLHDVDEQIEESRIMIILMAIIATITLGFILGYFVERWVDKPVKDLVDATNKVAVGNLHFQISAKSKDELGELALSFNNMTRKLSEMRLQLFQSDKMASLGQLAAGVAHELNNPLTGVLTYSSFLLKRTKDNPELQEDLNVIVRETKRSREIVKGLLDFARQSAPKKVKSSINPIIERAEKVISNQLKIKNIQLTKKLDKELPDIIIDPNQIQQVFLNLFVNALDAVKEREGKIIVDTSVVSLSPYGITQVKHAVCPNKHNLIDEDHKIDGLPSIRVKAVSGNNVGYINLDPIYGLHRHHYGIVLNKDKSVILSCPQCNMSLMSEETKCPDCGSACYKILVPTEGFLEGCIRMGANFQRWVYMDNKGMSDYIEISIQDNGSGIPSDVMDRIFDPFFSTKGQKGTGLGLSVVWGIIDNHYGRINVESKKGMGTKFTIRLPIKTQDLV